MNFLERLLLTTTAFFCFNSCDLNLTGNVEVDTPPTGNWVGKAVRCDPDDEGNPEYIGASGTKIGLYD